MKRLLLAAVLALSTGLAGAESLPEILTRIDAIAEKKAPSPADVAYLRTTLRKDDAPIPARERAAWALGQLKAVSAEPELLDAVEHKSLLVRAAALRALIRTRSKKALPAIIEIARRDPVLPLRTQAVEALGVLRDDGAVQPIADLSADERPEVRAACALTMAALQSKRNDFLSLLKELASDADGFVAERARLATALARGDGATAAILLQSEGADLRMAAAIYYEKNGMGPLAAKAVKKAANGEADDEVKDVLERALKAAKKPSAGAKGGKKKSTSGKKKRSSKAPKPS